MHRILIPLLLAALAAPVAAEPAVAPLDPRQEPLREASACPARMLDVVRDLRIALIVGPEGLETDRDLRGTQARICDRRGDVGDWSAAPEG